MKKNYEKGFNLEDKHGIEGKQINKRPAALVCVAAMMMLGLSGCINSEIVDSYKSYQDTVGVEYERYLNTGKRWDGKDFTEEEIKARKLNLETAKIVIKEAENAER
jgi:hypothetical protein